MVTTLKLTVRHLEAAPDDGNRYELIDGDLLMSRAPGIPHQQALGRLFNRLSNYLIDSPVGEVILTPGVVFSDYDAVIPDLVFVSADREQIITERGLVDAPDLIVEIVSPGKENSERDRYLKHRLYSQRGVREYWVVDPQMSSVEVYRPQENTLTLITTLRGADTLASPLLPGFTCDVAAIFA